MADNRAMSSSARPPPGGQPDFGQEPHGQMLNDLWQLLFDEDWASLNNNNEMLTNQIVFASMYKTVQRNNQDPNKERHICLVHMDYALEKLRIPRPEASPPPPPNIDEYLMFNDGPGQCYIMACLRGVHFGILFFDGYTQKVHYADSLHTFNFSDTEILSFADDLGFEVASIARIRSKDVQRQEDRISCGIFIILYCEKFCNEGPEWTLAGVDVGQARLNLRNILRESEFITIPGSRTNALTTNNNQKAIDMPDKQTSVSSTGLQALTGEVSMVQRPRRLVAESPAPEAAKLENFLDVVREIRGGMESNDDEFPTRERAALIRHLTNLNAILGYVANKFEGQGATLIIDQLVVQLFVEQVLDLAVHTANTISGLFLFTIKANMKVSATNAQEWSKKIRNNCDEFKKCRTKIAAVIKLKEKEKDTAEIQLITVKEEPMESEPERYPDPANISQKQRRLLRETEEQLAVQAPARHLSLEIPVPVQRPFPNYPAPVPIRSNNRVQSVLSKQRVPENRMMKKSSAPSLSDGKNQGGQNRAALVEPRLADASRREREVVHSPPYIYLSDGDENLQEMDYGGVAAQAYQNIGQSGIPGIKDQTTMLPQLPVAEAEKRRARRKVHRKKDNVNSEDEEEEQPPKQKKRRQRNDDVAVVAKTEKAPTATEKLRRVAFQESSDYYTQLSVYNARIFDNEKIYTEVQRKRLTQFEEKFDRNCGEMTANTCEIGLDTQFSDPENHRQLGDSIKKIVLPEQADAGRRKKSGKSGTLDKHPRLLFTHQSFENPAEVDGNDIIRKSAENSEEPILTALFKKEDVLFPFIKATGTVADEEREQIVSQQGENKDKVRDHNLHPFPLVSVKSKSEEEEMHVSRLMKTCCAIGIRGVDKIYGLKLEDLRIDAICNASREANIEQDITVARNMPQPTTFNRNYQFAGNKGNWQVYAFYDQTTLAVFKEHLDLYHELSKKARSDIAQNEEGEEKEKEILEELGRQLQSIGVPSEAVKKIDPETDGKPRTYIPLFCKNLDLNPETYKKQLDQIDLLMDCLKPNGKDDLLNVFSDVTMPGINAPQGYLKFPADRTLVHIEDGMLASVNLNAGPGDNTWYFVPLEYSGKLWKMMESKHLLDKSTKRHDKVELWPHPQHLIGKIPLQMHIQKPGEVVVTGIGSPHWVQSNGTTSNIAWNIGIHSFAQLACAAIYHDHITAVGMTPRLPLEPLIWQLLIQKKELDSDMKKLLKSMLMRSLEKCQRELIQMKKYPALESLALVCEESKFQKVMLCIFCECVLFNFKLEAQDGSIRCLACHNEKAIVDGEEVDPELMAFIRYETEKLAEMFNSLN